MLELIVKGLVLWFYDLILECVGFIGNLLLEVFSTVSYTHLDVYKRQRSSISLCVYGTSPGM